nr:TonB-dependent receptor [uncultured Sphingomonas sp.]
MTRKFARSLYATTASPVAMGVALAMFGTAPAFAQDATTPADEAQATTDANGAAAPADAAPASDSEIVVTGIRASLAKSEKTKRNNAAIVEAVSAEDIGKLPDVSIADSLARLPGVTAQRLEGRDQRLSIRGLGPDFGMTLLNGREQVTVGDNRGVEYDQYPSEFFSNVIVYKSPQANVIPAGISGTVDLRMLRPLETRKVFAVQLRGQMSDLKKLNPEVSKYGYRASATYVDKFADDTLGIAIGISKTRSPSQNERYNSWGFPTEGGNLIIGGAKPYVQSSVLDRTGAVATVQYRPTDSWQMTFDALYSKFKETQYLRGIEFPIAPAWGSGATISNAVVEDGLITSATVSGVVGVVRNDYNKRTANNFSLGLNNEFNLTDKLRLVIDGSWSRAKRTDFLLENYSGTGWNLTGAKDTLQIQLGKDNRYEIIPSIDYANPANLEITDPRGWGWNGTDAVVQAGFLNKPKFKDDLKALRASLDGEFNSALRWEAGAVYSRRSKDSLYTSYFLCPKDGDTDCTVSGGSLHSTPIPASAVKGTVSLDYLGVPGMIALDPMELYNSVYDASFDNRPDSLARDYNVTEKVLTGYAMLTIDSQLGSVPVTGTAGFQVVHTKQRSSGRIANYQSIDGVPTVTIAPASGGSSYTNLLPQVALSFRLTDPLYLKTGVSKTMVRPRMDQERVTQNVSVDFSKLASTDAANSAFSSTGGNPELEPYHSLNFDGSLEYYLPKGGYIALAAYYKKLTNFVDPNNATLYDFAALASALPPELQAGIGTTMGRLSYPDNTGRGHILGQELTVSLPFANFTNALEGFGVFGSLAHVKSKVRYGNSAAAITIPGFSKWVGTAEAYYESHGFQARLSYRYRSKFLAEIAGLSASPEFRTAKAEGILDGQIGYEFQPGSPMAGLAILLQGKNLTDRPFVTYESGDTRLVRDYQHYGRTYYLGLSYKF